MLLFMHLIDLQSADDSANRSLRSVASNDHNYSIMSRWDESLRANDNGFHSEEVGVEQGLHQGCVPSPFLFNIFFAGSDILTDFVHSLGELARVGPETPYCEGDNDDVYIVSRSPQDVFGAFDLTVPERKTET